MIDIADFQISGSNVLKNKLSITDGRALGNAEADLASIRLAELHRNPIAGAFTTEHLQQIHSYLFQDVYEWAGKLRQVELPKGIAQPGMAPTEIEKALDRLFDRLSSENHLKGSDVDQWAERCSYYVGGVSDVQPFLSGNALALQEFTRELALENGMRLRWDEEISDELSAAFQATRSANLRRLILLAIDGDQGAKRVNRRSNDRSRITDRDRTRELGIGPQTPL